MTDVLGHRAALITRVLEGSAMATPAQRRAAFDNEGVAESARTLIEKVVKHAYKVTDADIVAARAGGLTEDEIFELTVCAAIGVAKRQHDAALAALAAAVGGAA